MADQNELCQLAIENVLTDMINWSDWTLKRTEEIDQKTDILERHALDQQAV